jgi:hypothetical protein
MYAMRRVSGENVISLSMSRITISGFPLREGLERIVERDHIQILTLRP